METVVAPAGHAAALWTALNLLLLLLLSALVVRQRRRLRVAFGDAGSSELIRATRAFGNAAEYIPAGIGALAVLALVGANPLAIHGVGALPVRRPGGARPGRPSQHRPPISDGSPG